MTADPKALIERPDPWRIYVVFSESGSAIRKWSDEPFEIDGIRATEFHVAHMAGLHTCSDSCDRPACVLRRENERQQAENVRLREALRLARVTLAFQPHPMTSGSAEDKMAVLVKIDQALASELKS